MICSSKYSTNNEDICFIHASVVQKSASLYDLKFLAMNENLVDRKQGVHFGQFLVRGSVKMHLNSPNRTLQTHQTAHPSKSWGENVSARRNE